jgi:hypothetical protein
VLRNDIARIASALVTAAQSPIDTDTPPSGEFELNELVERAFALTESERSVLLSSLPPRDPLESSWRA